MVGGGDSALEAASRIADQPGTTVTLSYRGAAYARARAKNREAVAEMVAAGRIEELLNSNVLHIDEESVEIDCSGVKRWLANDDVIICAGGLLPSQFLKDTGIVVETKFGTV